MNFIWNTRVENGLGWAKHYLYCYGLLITSSRRNYAELHKINETLLSFQILTIIPHLSFLYSITSNISNIACVVALSCSKEYNSCIAWWKICRFSTILICPARSDERRQVTAHLLRLDKFWQIFPASLRFKFLVAVCWNCHFSRPILDI